MFAARTPTPITPTEGEIILHFLKEKSITTKIPLKIKHVWREYREVYRSHRTNAELEYFLNSEMLEMLYSSSEFDMETKMRVLFAIQYPVEMVLLDELEKIAEVLEVKDGVVQKFELGGVKLEVPLKRGRGRPRKEEGGKKEDVKKIKILKDSGDSEGPEDPEASKPSEVVNPKLEAKSESEGVNLQEYLKALRRIINFMDSSEFSRLLERTENAIEMKNAELQNIPLHVIETVLTSICKLAHSTFRSSSGDYSVTTSLKYFLKQLKLMIIDFDAVQLDDVQREIEECYEKVEEHDQKIPMSNILLALEMALVAVCK